MNWSTEDGFNDDAEPYGNWVNDRESVLPPKVELDDDEGEETRFEDKPDVRDKPANRGFDDADERHEPKDIFLRVLQKV